MRQDWTVRTAAGMGMLLIAWALSVGAPATRAAQQQHGTPPATTPGGIPMPSDAAGGVPMTPGIDAPKDHMENSRERMFENDRHKRLMQDSAKLLQMATDLKAAVDKTPKDQLSLDIVKRAGDIEKMAHDIKEREKN